MSLALDAPHNEEGGLRSPYWGKAMTVIGNQLAEGEK